MIKQVNKTELSKIINMHPKSVSRLTIEKLEEKLLKECWLMLKCEKIGNKIMYTLEYQEQDFDVVNYVEEEFKINDGNKFIEYIKARFNSINKNTPLSAGDISKKIGASRNSCYNWDKKLEEKGVVSQDGKLYKKINIENNTQPINPIITEEILAKLRSDWGNYIRPVYLQQECKVCGERHELEVHHINSFSKILNDTIQELNIDNNNFDLELLRKTFMWNQHIKGKYVTLCKKCHLEEHRFYSIQSYKLNVENEITKTLLKHININEEENNEND